MQMTDTDALHVDGDRLWASLMTMAEIGATEGGGSHRLALSNEDRQARDLVAKWCTEAGAELRIDAIGNMFARRAGTDPDAAPVLVGSHLDTQPMGGRFDGVLGVLAALEILRTLKDADVRTKRPIELVNWTNEEGARFAPAMLGSAVFAGLHDVAKALAQTDADGTGVGEALAQIGYAGEAEAYAPAAYFELHIEQGPILEEEGLPIGVVTHAQGVRWLDIVVEGAAAHAGTTPMDRRQDALVAAAQIIAAVPEIALSHPPAVGTVGTLAVSPGSRNVIPARAVFSVDLRHPDPAVLEQLTEEVSRAAEKRAGGCTVRVEPVLAFDPTTFDRDCVDAVRRGAERCGFGHRNIISGGGHDACNIARIAPAAMVFCPCVDGISHAEAEDIRPEWAASGADTLLHAVIDAANR